MAAKGAYGPQNPQLKMKKIIFWDIFTKNDLILPKNSPILHSDGFLSTLKMSLLDLDGAIFSFLDLF